MKTEPNFSSNYTVIGQCDIYGTLIENIKTANFSPKVEESQIHPIFTGKTNNNGKDKPNTGAAGTTDTGKPQSKRGNKSTGKPASNQENGNF